LGCHSFTDRKDLPPSVFIFALVQSSLSTICSFVVKLAFSRDRMNSFSSEIHGSNAFILFVPLGQDSSSWIYDLQLGISHTLEFFFLVLG
jgi:hypothetical protein